MNIMLSLDEPADIMVAISQSIYHKFKAGQISSVPLVCILWRILQPFFGIPQLWGVLRGSEQPAPASEMRSRRLQVRAPKTCHSVPPSTGLKDKLAGQQDPGEKQDLQSGGGVGGAEPSQEAQAASGSAAGETERRALKTGWVRAAAFAPKTKAWEGIGS